jgi:hypothetical protein
MHVTGATHRDNDLPSQTTLLANFNQLYKIDPDTLTLWVRTYNVQIFVSQK